MSLIFFVAFEIVVWTVMIGAVVAVMEGYHWAVEKIREKVL